METKPLPLRNDAVATKIMGALVSVALSNQKQTIEAILDQHYTTRKARKPRAAQHGGFRPGDKVTSIEAAMAVKVGPQQDKMLRALLGCKEPVTSYHLCELANVPGGWRRVPEIVAKGHAEAVGIKLEEGRSRTTYRITAAGRQYLAA